MANFKKFKELYEEAVKKELKQFEFFEKPVLTSFAKYVVEYFDGKLQKV